MAILENAEVQCQAATGDRCGEGALWHPAEQALYWTDINRFLIHRFSLEERTVRTWFFEQPVTALALTDRDETLAVVLGSGLILWEPQSDRRGTPLFRLPGWPFVRCNDARVDPRGSLWIGTMRNNVLDDGSPGEAGGTDGILYRVDSGGHEQEGETRIPSTIRSTKCQVLYDFGGLRRSPRVCKSLKNLKAEDCHGRGRGFEPRRPRHTFQKT